LTQVTKLTTFDKYLLSQLAATALGVAWQCCASQIST